MTPGQLPSTPARESYDVIIIGGAVMGSSAAWFLTDMDAFDGTILVVERDPTYATASTTHTNSCMRQQFSTELNVRISQFAADFVKNLRSYMGEDPRVPEAALQSYGYLYLANSDAFAGVLRANQAVQVAAGAETKLLTADEIRATYPFYAVDDIVLGSINRRDEGYFDGSTMFDWLKRKAREGGAEYIQNEVVAIHRNTTDTQVTSVSLASGETVSCGHLVNASGPRGAKTAALAGLDLPVEPRKRFTWIFTAEHPLDQPLPLTIDPSGAHVRDNGGGTYLAGGHADHDPAVQFDDFEMDHDLWLDKIWPAIATRIPQFEAIKVTSEWAGHYAMNVFDHNAIIGPHSDLPNFLLLNGFSGHGLQQSPAMGRATAEWITHGAYQTLDMSPFHYDRIVQNTPILERAVI